MTVPLALDHPVFVQTEVNLDDHIFESTLPAPADEETLSVAVAAILSTRLDRDKPLWRLDIIHGARAYRGGHHPASRRCRWDCGK